MMARGLKSSNCFFYFSVFTLPLASKSNGFHFYFNVLKRISELLQFPSSERAANLFPTIHNNLTGKLNRETKTERLRIYKIIYLQSLAMLVNSHIHPESNVTFWTSRICISKYRNWKTFSRKITSKTFTQLTLSSTFSNSKWRPSYLRIHTKD